MTEINGPSMKGVLLSSKPVTAMLDTLQKKLSNIRKFFSQVIPSKTINMEMVKQDVWRDLSAVYYKYEDNSQKRAFREIMSEVGDRINDGNWDSVYRKLHRIESTPSTIRL